MKKIYCSLVSLLLAAVLLFSCVSCGLQVSAAELSAGYTRTATETGELTEAFQTAMADFSVKLFQQSVTKDMQNDLVSPLSAVMCLALLANGADGNTLAQMEAALGMDIDTLNRCLYAYTAALYRADDCKVHLADSIWYRDDEATLRINETFLQTNADWYNAQIYAAPFDASTVKDINAWCKKQTDGMIDKIVDSLDEEDLMYLINALVFDAKWSNKYEKSDVEDGLFHNSNGSEKNVKMLSSEETVYLCGSSAQGFSKNYAGDKYSFVALLPDEGTDIYDYIDSLSGEVWQNLWNGREHTPVHVKMPEFTYSTEMNLVDSLKALGMTDMFGSGADFSKMGTASAGSLYCGEVRQKTFIQVDRNGTKAAAVTWGTMKATAMLLNIFIELDRPFVYAIVDNETGLPLFLGAVTNL